MILPKNEAELKAYCMLQKIVSIMNNESQSMNHQDIICTREYLYVLNNEYFNLIRQIYFSE